MKPIRLGRWQIELHQRAIHITREPRPNPKCAYCHGTGGHGFLTESGDGDWEYCHCFDFLAWRLPLWRRNARQLAERTPF